VKNLDNLLHIFGQPYWHQPVYIMGDRTGLLQLRAAIDQALAGDQGRVEVYTNDGEGYDVYVKHLSDEKQQQQLMLPYYDAPGLQSLPRKDDLLPWKLIEHYKPERAK
jgi:hypothetical protein